LHSPSIGKEEERAVYKLLSSKHLERGAATNKVEKTVTKMFKSKYAICITNATGGLLCSLKACGISEGDEVITTSFTFAATANSIILCGAKPVYVDIDSRTFNIDTNRLEKVITKKTKAIVAVDLYGHPSNYSAIKAIAKKYNLYVISDSAQAVGALYNNEQISSLVDIRVLSFYGTKSISSGEGGLVLTNNSKLAKLVNLLINHGQTRGEMYDYKIIGWNFRPTDIQSTLICAQLKRLKWITKRRNENAQFITKNLIKVAGIIPPYIDYAVKHAFSRYTIRVTERYGQNRDYLKKRLLEKGIETEIAYPKPLYWYKHLNFGYQRGTLPETEKASREVLSLPVHQNLHKKDLDKIIRTVIEIK